MGCGLSQAWHSQELSLPLLLIYMTRPCLQQAMAALGVGSRPAFAGSKGVLQLQHTEMARASRSVMQLLQAACLSPHKCILLSLLPVEFQSSAFCCQPQMQANHAKHRGSLEQHPAALHDQRHLYILQRLVLAARKTAACRS